MPRHREEICPSSSEHTYVRARELCQQIGETPQLFLVLAGLQNCYAIRGEWAKAHSLAEQLLRVAQTMQLDAFVWVAHIVLGVTLSFMGELTVARQHLEQKMALYDPQQFRALSGDFPDLEVGRLSRLAAVLGLLGYPDQALKRSEESLALAQELDHPFSLVFALSSVAEIQWQYGEMQAAQNCGEALIALSREQGFGYFLAYGVMVCGLAQTEQGNGEEGLAQIYQGLVDYRATGSKAGRPYWFSRLARAYGKTGRTKEGLATVAEGLDVVHNSGECWYEAELYWLKGELLLTQQGKNPQAKGKEQRAKIEAEVEACFQQAIDIARRQGAMSLELRTKISHARLWQKQGKVEEARQLLGDIYNWFTEGFDTKDLQEAKVLLQELRLLAVEPIRSQHIIAS